MAKNKFALNPGYGRMKQFELYLIGTRMGTTCEEKQAFVGNRARRQCSDATLRRQIDDVGGQEVWEIRRSQYPNGIADNQQAYLDSGLA